MSSLIVTGQKPLDSLLHEIDSYASLITKDFVAHGRRITREFPYDGELEFTNGKAGYLGQPRRIELLEGGIRFSVEVTEIFLSFLERDEDRHPMHWTAIFNNEPELRHLAITEAYRRIYPPAPILPPLVREKPATADKRTSTTSLAALGNQTLIPHPPSRPPPPIPAALPLPLLSRLASSAKKFTTPHIPDWK